MPRAGGVYTLPAGNPVVTLTVISTAWANTTMSDIATALTGSVPTDGTAPMTGPLRLADGAQNAPGLTWATETTTGLYRIAANQIGFSLNSVTTLQVNAARGWTISTPAAATVALTLNAVAGTAGLALNGGTGSFASLGFKDGQTGGTIWSVSVGVGAIGEFDIICNTTGNTALKIVPAGNVTIPAPTSGTALTVKSSTAAVPAIIADNSAAGGDAFTVSCSANATGLRAWTTRVGSTGSYVICTAADSGADINNALILARDAASNFLGATIVAPVSGNNALVVNGTPGTFPGGFALVINQTATASQAFGLAINAGTNTNDFVLRLVNAAQTTELLNVHGTGGMTLGAPTGGELGLGTLNAVALFVNGRPVVPITVSQPGTTSRTTAVLSNDAVFTLSIPSAGTWQFRLDSYINNGGVASAGIVYNINYSAAITAGAFSGSGEFSGSAISASGAIISSTVAGSTTNVTTGVLTSGVTSAGTIQGTIVAGAAGSLSLSWASTSTNGMNIGNGSFTATRIA